jgi:hypothetical protein
VEKEDFEIWLEYDNEGCLVGSALIGSGPKYDKTREIMVDLANEYDYRLVRKAIMFDVTYDHARKVYLEFLDWQEYED